MKASGSISIFDSTDDVVVSVLEPVEKSIGMLWLDTSPSSQKLKRWDGAAWIAVISDEVKTSSITIKEDNIDISSTGKVNIDGGELNLSSASELNIAAGGKANIIGGEIDIKAEGALNVSGGGTVNITGSAADGDGELNISSGGSLNVSSDGELNISGGAVSIDSDSTFDLHATNGAEGDGEKYLGISSGGEYVMFSGANDALGNEAKFSVSKDGELVASDASIRGDISVEGQMNFGEDSDVSFAKESRIRFFKALLGDSVMGYLYGGTNADSREGAMSNFGLKIGSDVPTNDMGQEVGDRYLLVRAGVTYSDTNINPALSGYSCTKTTKQRRFKTETIYHPVSGGSKATATSYTGWVNIGDTTYGEISSESAAYCYNEAGTSTNVINGAVTSQDGGHYEDNLGYIFEVEIRKTQQTRIYTRKTYWISCAAPISTDFQTTSIKAMIASFARNSTDDESYSLYSSTSANGQENQIFLGSVTATATDISINITDAAKSFQSASAYLCLERTDSAVSASAVTINAPSIVIKYFGGEKRLEEYVWDGVTWALLANANPYVHFPDCDYTDVDIVASRTDGTYIAANMLDSGTRNGWVGKYTSAITDITVTATLPAALTQITIYFKNRSDVAYRPEVTKIQLYKSGTLVSEKTVDLTEQSAALAKTYIRMNNNNSADSVVITFTKGTLGGVSLRRMAFYGYLAETTTSTMII